MAFYNSKTGNKLFFRQGKIATARARSAEACNSERGFLELTLEPGLDEMAKIPLELKDKRVYIIPQSMRLDEGEIVRLWATNPLNAPHDAGNERSRYIEALEILSEDIRGNPHVRYNISFKPDVVYTRESNI